MDRHYKPTFGSGKLYIGFSSKIALSLLAEITFPESIIGESRLFGLLPLLQTESNLSPPERKEKMRVARRDFSQIQNKNDQPLKETPLTKLRALVNPEIKHAIDVYNHQRKEFLAHRHELMVKIREVIHVEKAQIASRKRALKSWHSLFTLIVLGEYLNQTLHRMQRKRITLLKTFIRLARVAQTCANILRVQWGGVNNKILSNSMLYDVLFHLMMK